MVQGGANRARLDGHLIAEGTKTLGDAIRGMTRNLLIIIALMSVLNVCSCSDSSNVLVKGAVLSRGQSVEAHNRNGTIRISYITPVKRKFDWDGKSKVIKMIPREEAFDRKLGLYEPAEAWGLNLFETRLVVQESTIDFDNYHQIYASLKQSSAVLDWVYTSDGLVVGFGRTPSRKQINIDLWQLLIGGQKPKRLAGARPSDIRLIETR